MTRSGRPRVAFVDAHDSFAWNVADALARAGADVRMFTIDDSPETDRIGGSITHLVLGPGPGDPSTAGRAEAWLRAAEDRIPVLGVCLGMQCLAARHGVPIVTRPPVHGHPAEIRHAGEGPFAGLADPFVAGRYHSLGLPDDALVPPLRLIAATPSGVPMGIARSDRPVWGVQFHPESVLSPHGDRVFANFLAAGRVQPWTVGSTPRGAITSAS